MVCHLLQVVKSNHQVFIWQPNSIENFNYDNKHIPQVGGAELGIQKCVEICSKVHNWKWDSTGIL